MDSVNTQRFLLKGMSGFNRYIIALLNNRNICILLDFLSAMKQLTSLSGVERVIYRFFSGH